MLWSCSSFQTYFIRKCHMFFHVGDVSNFKYLCGTWRHSGWLVLNGFKLVVHNLELPQWSHCNKPHRTHRFCRNRSWNIHHFSLFPPSHFFSHLSGYLYTCGATARNLRYFQRLQSGCCDEINLSRKLENDRLRVRIVVWGHRLD